MPWIEAIWFLCSKIGIGLVVHMPCYDVSKGLGCILGHTVKLDPCAMYPDRMHDKLEFSTHSQLAMLDSFLKTKTFSVEGFKAKLCNPWFQHLELLDCKSIEEFNVNADLIFPDDISAEVHDYFLKEIDGKTQS